MSEQKCRKVYVPVNLDVDAEGNIRPRLIRWIDGRVYEIDRLKHKCRAASTKVGGCGIHTVDRCSQDKRLHLRFAGCDRCIIGIYIA